MNIDYSRLGVSAGLPPLNGAEPTAACPFCGKMQIPPESDDGWPPAGEYHYACDASYVLPEDETLPQVLEPCRLCSFVPTRLALAWLRDSSEADPALTKVASTIRRVVPEAPPYRVEARSPLAISLPRPEGARTPATCPICGAATTHVSESFHRYACGGSFWSIQRRPGPNGSMIPEVWQCSGSCERAPVAVMLRVLQARNEPEWKAVCDEALAALE